MEPELHGAPVAADRVERRLAAILAADVAGYSRLMGADDEGILVKLKAHRSALVDPKIKEHRGRVVKTTGDEQIKAIERLRVQHLKRDPTDTFNAWSFYSYESLTLASRPLNNS